MSLTSSTFINGTAFHGRKGVVKLPRRETAVFTSPTSRHVGAQVSSVKGPPFQLMLTKYGNASDLRFLQNYIDSLVGQVVALQIDGINYSLPQHGSYKFFISYADVVRAEVIPHASGIHGNARFDFTPAAKLVTQMVLYAVPA